MLVLLLLGIVVLAIVLYLHRVTAWKPQARKDAFELLPWVGFPRGPLAQLRGMFIVQDLKAIMHEAYLKYGKKDIAYVIPTFLWPARIVLPPSMIPWLLRQPEQVLSFGQAVTRVLSFETMSLDALVMERPSHPAVVRGPLTRSLAWMPQRLHPEIQKSFAHVWRTPTEWTDIKLFESILSVSTRTTLRVFLASETSLADGFVDAALNFANSFAMLGTLLRPLPASVRRRMSWLFLWSHRRHFERLYHFLEPLIERRKRSLLQQLEDPDSNKAGPDDLLYWLVQSAHGLHDPREWETPMVAKRFAVVLFAAQHTTTWTIANLFLNLLSADPKYDLLATLQAEINEVGPAAGQEWSKSQLAQLLHMDSAMRESMRLHSMMRWSLQRVVAVKGGIDLPNGIHVPQGAALLVSGHEIMRDDANYPSGVNFDPFRFSRERIAFGPKKDGNSNRAEPLSRGDVDAATINDTFFAFGGGRNACPGRFFVVQLIKLILIHVLASYEMKPISHRPPEIWLSSDKVPDFAATISIRRKGTQKVMNEQD